MSEKMPFEKSIGIWMPDKKSLKLNWKELNHACSSYGFNLIKLELERPLEDQGRIDVLLHKLIDLMAVADEGDVKALINVRRVEQYLSNHPNIVVIDPLDKVRMLLNRYCHYTLLQDEKSFQYQGIFTPAFAKFTTNNIEQNIEIMKQRGVRFPVICKPIVAQCSKSAHEMVLIFNERGLDICKAPCLVQSFVNHNAVLHKVYLVGNRYHISERPSLKNFYASDDLKPIYYRTAEVCKADSQSSLSILDPHDNAERKMIIDDDKIKSIIRVLRKKIGLTLLGFDLVIDNRTGHHAVIDLNVFPSYDKFPNFFENLLEYINESLFKRNGDTSESNGLDNLVGNYRLNGLINVDESRANYRGYYTNMNIIN